MAEQSVHGCIHSVFWRVLPDSSSYSNEKERELPNITERNTDDTASIHNRRG